MATTVQNPFLSRILKIDKFYTQMGDLLVNNHSAYEAVSNEFKTIIKTHFSLTTPNHYHTIFLGFSNEQREEIVDWIQTNCSNTVWYCQYRLWFKTSKEAFAFKMRWL